MESLWLEIPWSSLCNGVMWLWWLAHLHPHRRRVMFSVVRTEEGQQVGFLHMTEPSSSHNCLTHQEKACGDGASCQFISWQYPRWLSVMDPARINSSTAHTHFLSSPCSILTNYEGMPDTLAEKCITKILKCFTISAGPCIYANSTSCGEYLGVDNGYNTLSHFSYYYRA